MFIQHQRSCYNLLLAKEFYLSGRCIFLVWQDNTDSELLFDEEWQAAQEYSRLTDRVLRWQS